MEQSFIGHVFISYSRNDQAIMRRIVDFLRNHRIKVWVDHENLIPGTPIWEEEIEEAIRAASAIVVLMSPDSKISEWVRREISYADQYQKRIFPVLISGDEDSAITLRLITRQYIDFRQNENAGLNSLSAALQHYFVEPDSALKGDTKHLDQRESDKKHFVQKSRLSRWEQIRKRINFRNPLTIVTLSILFIGYCGILCLNTLLGVRNHIFGFAFAPDGKTLATGGVQEIKLWQIDDGNLLKSIDVDSSNGASKSLVFSPDGQIIAVGSSSRGDIQLKRISDGSLIQTLEGHIFSIESLAFSPDGNILASGSMDNAIILWQVSDGNLLRALKGHESTVASLTFSPDGKILASGSHDGTIRLWQINDGSPLQTLTVKGNWINYVNTVAFSSNGEILASGSSDDIVRLWDVNHGSLLQSLVGHRDDINAVAFSPDGQIVASGSDDETVRLWNAGDGRLLHTLKERSGKIRIIAFSPDGFTIACFTDENNILLWRISDGILLLSTKLAD